MQYSSYIKEAFVSILYLQKLPLELYNIDILTLKGGSYQLSNIILKLNSLVHK